MNHRSTKLILEADDENDVEKIKSLAHDLGVKIISEEHPKNNHQIERYRTIISKGGDVSYIPDPAAWQKETRDDR